MAVGGGAVMLAVAAAAHDSASLWLVVIGGGWLVTGLLGARRYRNTAREIWLKGQDVTFLFPRSAPVTIPASEVIEFRYARLDPSRLTPMRVRTARSGTVQVVPRMSGLLDMLVELRRLNPQLKLP
jgi:hypothetical protein